MESCLRHLPTALGKRFAFPTAPTASATEKKGIEDERPTEGVNFSRSLGGQFLTIVGTIDYAVTATTLFTDEAIQKGLTPIKAAHIVELRKAIDALRAAVNLSPVWQNAPRTSGGVIA